MMRLAVLLAGAATVGALSRGLRMSGDADLLVRALKGEAVERTPVWLMRQAGRYMADFRKFSEKYPFRQRSETPEIAVELSLQPWRSFGVDGVIMFSDILTPLPAMGVDFTIVEGKGPKIMNTLKSREDLTRLKVLGDVDKEVPFLRPILQALRKETEGKTSLIGFIGAPWTLVAYSVEGGHSKLCVKMKRMCNEDPDLAHAFLSSYTDSLCAYASHQIESGAQVLQVFESWAHHMTEKQFEVFARPYATRIADYLRARHPNVPLVYFANGGSVYLHAQTDMHFDAIAIDWRISMYSARKVVGPNLVLQGNVDPIVLYGPRARVEAAARLAIEEAGGKHVMNLGHGVEKDISEDSVAAFVNAVKEVRLSV